MSFFLYIIHLYILRVLYLDGGEDQQINNNNNMDLCFKRS